MLTDTQIRTGYTNVFKPFEASNWKILIKSYYPKMVKYRVSLVLSEVSMAINFDVISMLGF